MGETSKEKFLKGLEVKVTQISSQPKSAPLVDDFDNLHWCVITSQCSFYYRVLKNEIEVITITDNRQDPDKIIKEIRLYFNP